MSLDRATILAATPHYYVKGAPSQLGMQYEDLSHEVRSAIGELRWSVRNPDDLRLLAYAHYAGALNEQELASRLTGSDQDLLGDLIDIFSLAATAISDADLDDAIESVFWDRTDPWKSARNSAEGWVNTVLELIQVVRPSVLPLLLRGDDSSRVALSWLLTHTSSGIQAESFASVLMESSNQRDWEAAAAFLTHTARDYVFRNKPAPSVPKSGNASARLIVSGILLTEIFNFGRSRRRLSEPQAITRWEQFVETLRDAVTTATRTAKDARELLKSQDKDDPTLLTLILGKTTGATNHALTDAGDALIKQYFRPLVKSDQRTREEKLPYLGPLVTNDLLKIWIQIGADDGFFWGLAEELRCDEYAFEFTYSHYLTDRPRAMILAALGAVAGFQMKNDGLRLAGLALADSLRSLPEGVSAPFDEATRADLQERTGILLPIK